MGGPLGETPCSSAQRDRGAKKDRSFPKVPQPSRARPGEATERG